MAENRELALILKLVADQFQSELKKSGGALSSFNAFVRDWKTQLTVAGTALVAIAKNTANYAEVLVGMSEKTGLTVDAVAKLKFAAESSDTSLGALETGLKALALNMAEASQKTGDGVVLFRRLGVAAVDAQGRLRPMQDVLLDIADRFAKLGDGKLELALKAFGKSGTDMIPFLSQGKAGITALMDEAVRLGKVMSEQDARAAKEFNDQIVKLQASMHALVLAVGTAVIPTLGRLAELLTTIAVETRTSPLHHLFRGLSAEMILLNNWIKELSANFQFLFGKMTFEELKARIAELEAETERKFTELALEGVLSPEGTEPKRAFQSGDRVPTEQFVFDQDELRHLKEVGDMRVAAEDELIERMRFRRQVLEEGTLGQLRLDRAQQFDAPKKQQRDEGLRIVEQAQREFAARERDLLADNLQAWIEYHEQVGGSAELRYSKELDLVRTNLAKQTELTVEETGRLLIAWQNHDTKLAEDILDRTTLTETQKETIQLKALSDVARANNRASDDVFSGWEEGMRGYVRDIESGFGLGADMARRTAQQMEQSFRTFFFDLFEGRIKTLKDVLRGVLDFVKQIAAQIAAQLAVRSVLSGFGFGKAESGGMVQRFAGGGPVLGFGNQDTVPALLSPGEFVLSRRDVSDIKRGAVASQTPEIGAITVNVINSGQQDKPTVNVRRALSETVIDIIFQDVRSNGPLRQLLQGA